MIEPNAAQPRRRFDEQALSELADSIAKNGVITPIAVRRLSSGYYQIIAGERRWRAARMAGLSEIPAVLIEADDRRASELALIENLQRQDLDPIEEAEGYRTLIEDYGLTQEEAAQNVGKSRPAVANAMRLLSLPEEVRDMISEGKISAGHARAILAIEDRDRHVELARRMAQSGMSVRQAESLAKRMSSKKETKKKAAAQVEVDYLAEVEKKIESHLGRKVKIVEGRKKGRIEIEYYGNDDLDTLIKRLCSDR